MKSFAPGSSTIAVVADFALLLLLLAKLGPWGFLLWFFIPLGGVIDLVLFRPKPTDDIGFKIREISPPTPSYPVPSVGKQLERGPLGSLRRPTASSQE
jgi:hypothetical protein